MNLKQKILGYSTLQNAISEGNYGKFKPGVLMAGNKINHQDNEGKNALITAIVHDQPEFAAELIERGIDCHCPDHKGRTPLHWACREGNTPIAKLLLQTEEIDVDHQDNEGYTPVYKAIANGNFQLAKTLMDAGADIGHCAHDNNLPIDRMAEKAGAPEELISEFEELVAASRRETSSSNSTSSNQDSHTEEDEDFGL